MISYCRRRKKTQRGDTETLQCGNDTRWWCMSLYNVRGFAVVTAQFDLSVMQRKTASLFAVVIIFCVYIYTFDLSVTLCVTAVWNTMCCVSVVCRRGGGVNRRERGEIEQEPSGRDIYCGTSAACATISAERCFVPVFWFVVYEHIRIP